MEMLWCRRKKKSIEIKTYRIIYDAIEDIKSAMVGMLDPEYKRSYTRKSRSKKQFIRFLM